MALGVSALLLLGLSAAVDPRPVLSRSSRPTGLALVVGVEHYRGDLPPAEFAANDARSFAAFAQATLGIPKARVKLLVDDHAGSADLESALAWLEANARPDGEVFFYFSGHGTPSLANGSAVLVPWDASPDEVASHGLPVAALLARLRRLRSRDEVVFLDACFSGAGKRSLLSKGKRPLIPIPALPHPGGMVLFYAATSAKGISGLALASPHGLFTFNLLNGLRGAADLDGDGTVTAGELGSYVHSRVSAQAEEGGSQQVPSIDLGKEGSLPMVEEPGTDAPGFGGSEPTLTPNPRPTAAPVAATPCASPNSCDQGCEAGDWRSCTDLGKMYAKGQGVVQDYARAVQLFQKGCNGGDAHGCTNLGIMYDNGQGVVQDYAQAVQLYQKGCNGGDAHGCSHLGTMYARGRGVVADRGRAWSLYRQACRMDRDDPACGFLKAHPNP